MSNEVLDTDFLPINMITTVKGCYNELGKCNSLRIALNKHQLDLVKKLAKLQNKIVVEIEQNMFDAVICDYVVCNKDEKDTIHIGEREHYSIEDFGDCYETERRVLL